MEESSSAAPSQPKPVVVRVKRKPSQSPLDAFWLEINERPLKRSLLDLGKLTISGSAQKVEFHNKKVFVQHVETISSSEVTFDIVQSFVDPDSSCASISKSKFEERKNFFKKNNKQDQLLVKAKQEKESLAKDARFEQIWKSRKGNKGTGTGTKHDKALLEICNFYDIVRVDNEEKKKEVQEQEMSLEDQRLLSSYLPLLREFIPNAAEEVEADLIAHLGGHSKEENYVYDLYTVTDEMDTNTEDTLASYPLVQVEEEEDYYDGPDDSDYESDDSNAENNPLNDYPDEVSEEDEEEVEDSGSESEGENGDASNESSNEDTEHHGFSKGDADPYDKDFDEYEGVCNDDENAEDEDWRWSYR
ncbi:RNA-directed DNA methylation 4 [Vigna unguiculata]|nr:RNA-directed DNA methylation 4 [Vigna unguiculata]XP_027929099.1 RNA-directed DNA methylation 4 [Vigna unguiculata]XP_027929101.1 RNA-directed DNA methylation 4 [Vigna unguiculata]XP_027929102.1 RNA-directed DNA methylation 4 [Vigna unguiculata]XP_027929103.1 RNA-directed DNA methylation 4 [Vigna unguiculata]XP_027929104.1 RNA-directed DNA methylation 4 [Vigna unguiculata]